MIRSIPLMMIGIGCLMAGVVCANQEPSVSSDGRLVMDLSGRRWQMEGIRPGQGLREGFHLHFGEVCPSTFNWNGAAVPGDVYTDLWRAGEIDEPHFGRNSLRAKWAMEKEWWYRYQFAVPAHWKGKTVRVVFEGVDYACEVWMNGQHLGRHEGMFSAFAFDASALLKYNDDARANALVVRLDPPPRAYRNVAGRKFGWQGDYWRALTPMGIWKPVRLEATGALHLSDVYPTSKMQADSSATVKVQVNVSNFAPDRNTQARVKTVIRGKNFIAGPYEAERTLTVTGKETNVTVPVRIPQAKRWWPWELGRPNLYVAETSVYNDQGVLSDRCKTSFGIREIRMAYNPGYTREEVRNPWTLMINGKRLFLRSANWGGPPDIFYGGNSPEKYRKLVQLARDANINNLRIFGWHPTEVDLFYELCNEMGITVWQDLIPLASVRLPEDQAFRDATYAEAVAVIKDLRSHPSLVLLEGGEEMFYGTQGLEYMADFLVGLGQAIAPYSDLPYVPTSPLNWPTMLHKRGLGGKKDSGHTHFLFYAAGARLLEDYIAEWDYAVIPEFAISSAPNVESIRNFIPADELWPPGPSWGFHWADLDAFRALNDQVLGDECMDSLEGFVEATQVNQGTIFQWGIEHTRRRKPKSSAISICHFITFAPDFKWGIVDYYQQPKRSFDFVKRAYQPLLVSMACDKRRWLPGETFSTDIWIVNDLHQDFKSCKLKLRLSDHQGRQMSQKRYAINSISPDSSAQYETFTWPVQGRVGETFRIDVVLQDVQGQLLSANHHVLLLGDQEKARQRCQQMAAEWQALKRQFPTADYYRFFPELSGQPAK